MRLAYLRSLVFREQAPAPSPTPVPSPAQAAMTVTKSSDVAGFARPIGIGSMRKKSRRHIRESTEDEALPHYGFQNAEAYSAVALDGFIKQAAQPLGEFGIAVLNKGRHVLIKAPTGRKYDVRYERGWVVLVRSGEPVRFPDDSGVPRVKGLPFLAWHMPSDEEAKSLMTCDETIHKMVFDTVPWLIKTEAMTEFPAFVDLSVDQGLDETMISKIAKKFKPILNPKEYQGGFNNFEMYRRTYGPFPERDVSGLPSVTPPPLAELQEAVHPERFMMKYQPYWDRDNDYGRQFVWDEWSEQSTKIAALECNGIKGSIQNQYIYWGDNVRFVASFNIVDWLEVLCPDKDGNPWWCNVYAFPKIPKGSFDDFLSEMSLALKKIHVPTKFEPYDLDMADLAWRSWHGIVPDWYFCGGLTYHMDGTWGMFFYPCAYGRGLPMNENPLSRGMHYLWRLQPNGLLLFCVDQNQMPTHTASQPSSRDLAFYFYPRQGERLVAEMIKRYTYSS